MAKLYKYPEGGVFYDTFGGKIGEVEEIWAGDSFNRGALDWCYANAACVDNGHVEGVTSTAISSLKKGEAVSTADCAINTKAFGEIAYGSNCDSDNLKLCVNDIAFKTDTDSLRDRLCDMQEQIDELKKSLEKKNIGIKIRPALKTLQYEREVV